MECVSTTSTSVLERELRQDDLLSPFLFLIVAEELNFMINVMMEAGIFTGYKVSRSDGGLIRALKALHILFEASSGLKVKFHKSMLVGVIVLDFFVDKIVSLLTHTLYNYMELKTTLLISLKMR
jgi:hypothetical protein